MDNAFSAPTTLITLLPEIAIMILCIYYFSVKKTVDGLLLSIGSGVGFLMSAFFRLLPIFGSEIYGQLTASGM